MTSAAPQEGIVQPSKGRLRIAGATLTILALAVVLSMTAFYTVCAEFWSYDDLGGILLTQKTLAAGHPLYDESFTPYGPAFFAWERLLHIVTRLPLSHDSTYLFTTGAWVIISLLCAGYVGRITRNLFLTALTCFAVFVTLLVFASEPGHPQEFSGLLLGGMLLAASFLNCRRHTGLILGLIGVFVGLLSMTKPNLGVFAALAGWLSLCNWLAAWRSRAVLFGVGALAALALPVSLMRHNLGEAGAYCLLVSGAIALLITQLATSQPERSLPLRSIMAPVAGFVAALATGAGYALATGTSVGGLIQGLVLQHIGFDRFISNWPAFGIEDVLMSLGLATLVWVATGPGRDFWKGTPWVPTLVKFSVAPLVILAALVAAPGINRELASFNPNMARFEPAFVLCLPLVAALGQFSARQPRSTWEVAPRQFAVSLAVMSALWGYPMWGSQARLSFFLLIPVAVVWGADALRYGCWQFGKVDLLSPLRHKTTGMTLSCLGALGIVGLSLAGANSAAQAYHRQEPSGLRGSRLLHMPRGQAEFYDQLVKAVQRHGRSFYAMPGLGSLYFWTGMEPPTSLNDTTWMILLTPAQQSRVVEDLQRTPDLCVVRWPAMLLFRTHGRDFSENKVARYIEDNFVSVESFAGCDILVRRRASAQASGGRGGI